MIEPLTKREHEILQLVVDGLTNPEIGQRLGISDKTVKNHLWRMFEKREVTSRTQLAIHALRTGLVALECEAR